MFAPDAIGGAPVTADASAYPRGTISPRNGKVTASALELLKGAQDGDLAGMKGHTAGVREFFKSFGVLNTMVLHDTYHRGQMNLLAKA